MAVHRLRFELWASLSCFRSETSLASLVASLTEQLVACQSLEEVSYQVEVDTSSVVASSCVAAVAHLTKASCTAELHQLPWEASYSLEVVQIPVVEFY